MYRTFGKRLLDVLLALVLLVCSLPLQLAGALLLAVAQRGQVWFVQQRPGLQGKPFRLLKFKTMADLYDDRGQLLPDAQRLTKAGTFIRRLSLDELPQLWNVLAGDMSLVGPRPLLMEYLPLYSPEQWQRHLVRPGITGWAQINGRNATTWPERLAHDVWYVRHLSFRLDLKILMQTVGLVLSGKGISAPGQATMEKFRG